MYEKPRDVADLYLVPLMLELDSRLESFGLLEMDALSFEISLETNREPQNSEQRRAVVLDALTRNTDLHGWRVSWDPRGLRLAHGNHTVVLGLPANVRSYLDW